MTLLTRTASRNRMPRRRSLFVGLVACLAVTTTPAWAQGDPQRGKTIFNRCSACHSTTGQNKIAAPLDGIVGRTAATSAGARYSNALKQTGIVWTEDNLDRFLQAPRQLVPGTTMMIGVPAAQDRADLIAFLATLAPQQN